MIAIATALAAIVLSLLIARVATVALVLTGMPLPAARFPARSALSGTGFTTSEAEAVVSHPVRRRIVMVLMPDADAGALGSRAVAPPRNDIDARFVMANERTFLAWIRTSFALIAGGVVAAKALDFDTEVWRWIIAAPPMLAGALLAVRSRGRYRAYDAAMRSGGPLPPERDASTLAVGLAVYAVVVLVASAAD